MAPLGQAGFRPCAWPSAEAAWLSVMKTAGSIEIDRPIEVFFDYTINNVPEWSETVVEETVLEKNSHGNTKRFHMVTKDHKGKPMEFEGEVTVDTPPTTHTGVMKNEVFEMEATYSFEDLGGRTRVDLVSDVTPKSFGMKLMFLLFGWLGKNAGCKALQNELSCLKEKAEALGS